ncbi:hypothetical protein ACFVH6_30410 [Spirillospora sp. NPDC127200]
MVLVTAARPSLTVRMRAHRPGLRDVPIYVAAFAAYHWLLDVPLLVAALVVAAVALLMLLVAAVFAPDTDPGHDADAEASNGTGGGDPA